MAQMRRTGCGELRLIPSERLPLHREDWEMQFGIDMVISALE
jgi:hypothetical protein